MNAILSVLERFGEQLHETDARESWSTENACDGEG
jgi:hypothetical protein